jgi:transcription elongation factor GreA
MQRIPMTPEGHEKLRSELSQLKTVERAKNIKDIEEARAHGDLSENAEYHAAKEKQGLIGSRILYLENIVGLAEVIDPKKIKVKDKIVFGASVKLYDIDGEEEVTYKIVGDDESDAKQKRVGISSPIARAMIGRAIGDEVTVKTPKGNKEFEVLSVEYI